MSKFLGEPIDQGVTDQLSRRGDIMSSRNRTPEQLRYLASRTSWVRLTSGVDTETGPDESKELILQGGSGYYNSIEDKLFLRGGISFQNNDPDISKAYNTTGAFGTRPMPGITDFSVKCKGRFGSIKETNISFNVWSLEDLERVERLFFRLGYSCIVEWGHSIYVENDETITTGGLTANYNQFFDSPSSREKAQSVIDSQKENTSYNYDGFVGLIKNFSWGFRADGGYDCNISIVSLGEIMESLKTDKSTLDLEPLPSSDKESNSSKARASYFHFLNYALSENTPTDGSFQPLRNIEVKKAQSSIDSLVTSLRTDIEEGGLGSNVPLGVVGFNVATDRSEGTQEDQVVKVFYITLRTFLAMLNRFYLLKVNNVTEPKFDVSLDRAPKFNTHKGHYSSDPFVCLLPTSPNTRSISSLKLTDLYEGDNSTILNIPISLPYIIETYNSLTEGSDAESFSLLVFVNKIIAGIREALGRVNDFDVVYDDETRLFSIVDRNKIDVLKSELPELDLVGLRTTVSDLKIESKISSRLGSQIAIAAQASPQSSTSLLTNLIKWNEGKADRFALLKSENQTSDNTSSLPSIRSVEAQLQRDLSKEKYNENLNNLYRKLNRTPGEYVSEEWQNLQKESFQDQIEANQNSKKEKNFPLAGIIPIDVSFTLDGIGGIKIGQSVRFKKGFLLPKYETFSYIVTRVDHSIGQDNRWTTQLQFNPIIYP